MGFLSASKNLLNYYSTTSKTSKNKNNNRSDDDDDNNDDFLTNFRIENIQLMPEIPLPVVSEFELSTILNDHLSFELNELISSLISTSKTYRIDLSNMINRMLNYQNDEVFLDLNNIDEQTDLLYSRMKLLDIVVKKNKNNLMKPATTNSLDSDLEDIVNLTNKSSTMILGLLSDLKTLEDKVLISEQEKLTSKHSVNRFHYPLISKLMTRNNSDPGSKGNDDDDDDDDDDDVVVVVVDADDDYDHGGDSGLVSMNGGKKSIDNQDGEISSPKEVREAQDQEEVNGAINNMSSSSVHMIDINDSFKYFKSPKFQTNNNSQSRLSEVSGGNGTPKIGFPRVAHLDSFQKSPSEENNIYQFKQSLFGFNENIMSSNNVTAESFSKFESDTMQMDGTMNDNTGQFTMFENASSFDNNEIKEDGDNFEEGSKSEQNEGEAQADTEGQVGTEEQVGIEEKIGKEEQVAVGENKENQDNEEQKSHKDKGDQEHQEEIQHITHNANINEKVISEKSSIYIGAPVSEEELANIECQRNDNLKQTSADEKSSLIEVSPIKASSRKCNGPSEERVMSPKEHMDEIESLLDKRNCERQARLSKNDKVDKVDHIFSNEENDEFESIRKNNASSEPENPFMLRVSGSPIASFTRSRLTPASEVPAKLHATSILTSLLGSGKNESPKLMVDSPTVSISNPINALEVTSEVSSSTVIAKPYITHFGDHHSGEVLNIIRQKDDENKRRMSNHGEDFSKAKQGSRRQHGSFSSTITSTGLLYRIPSKSSFTTSIHED
ncbi:hypothetical protein DASC09_029810 [Saccharomycopsis crataegensis]|uniref:Uncharacterized protein n=1 Tax=Saccharomycopsis crataegensis TaxID=43959 RepID=A0AAV5QM60_9ASCO|nr:hypothetical protein DASC09_029810 [Saccharomycopsis crataegensis]